MSPLRTGERPTQQSGEVGARSRMGSTWHGAILALNWAQKSPMISILQNLNFLPPRKEGHSAQCSHKNGLVVKQSHPSGLHSLPPQWHVPSSNFSLETESYNSCLGSGFWFFFSQRPRPPHGFGAFQSSDRQAEQNKTTNTLKVQ